LIFGGSEEMIKTSIEKLASEIGWDIGNSDDNTQANLLNGFCKALSNSMDKRNREMQICYIVNKLDRNTMEVIEEFMGFIELAKKSK